MNEIDFINKWSPNGFENPYPNYCFKLDLEDLKKHIKAEVIEEVVQYVKLHRKYAEYQKDDFVFFYPMYEWLEQLMGQNK